MKVQRIDNSVYHSQTTPSPSFRAKGLDPEVINALNKNGKGWAKFLSYAGEHQGEMLNILVTAFGTAIVCPLFIRYNPFSKEDKETRAYSAWRQPISAIIAVAAQLTITKWFNNRLAQMASTSDKDGNAHFSRADLRSSPHERHLKTIVESRHPEWTKEQVDKEVSSWRIGIEKAEIDKARKAMKDTKIEISDLICQDYMEKAKSEIFDELKVEFKSEIESKFGKPVEDVWSLKLNKFLEKKLAEKAKLANKDSQKYITERAELYLSREIASESVIKYAVEKLFKKHGNSSIDAAIQNCTEKDVMAFIERENLTQYIGEDVKPAKLAKEIIKKLRALKEWDSSAGRPDWASKKFLGNTFDEIMQSIKIKKLIVNRNSDAKRVFKTMNTQLGLLVTLATLPITCGLLNWAYPRIMEKIMPEMSAKKKAKTEPVKKEGGDD